MTASYRRYEELLDEDLQDPVRAAGYLNACLEGGDPNVFLLALRDVVRARGGIAKLAGNAVLNCEQLDLILSDGGSVELKNLEGLLSVMGFRLSIKLKEAD